MATDTHDRYLSNVLLYTLGNRPEYAIDVETVNVTTGMTPGAVLYDNAGVWTLVAVANTAAAAGVLVDERALYGDLPTGNTSLKVAKRTCAVAANFLSYAADVDTQPEIDAVNAVLEAAGIKVETTV
jgi:hypothetical protein